MIAREEADISHLPDDMADVLYPGRRPRPLRVTLVFDHSEDAEGARAVDLARRSPQYAEETAHGVRRHRAAFETREAGVLRSLFELVGSRPATEVLIDGKAVPYARELWLPLFWLFVREEGA